MIGVASILFIAFFQTITNTDEHNSQMLKEVTEAAMWDSVDYAYFRKTGYYKINKEKFKISLWDLGFWQIRKSLKDAELGSDILKEIKNKRSCLKANIYNDIDNFIF